MNKKLTLLSTAMLSATSLFAADKNPNIILILADDMRGTAMDFLGVEDIHTPNLDKLAAEYRLYERSYHGRNLRRSQYAEPCHADDR